MAKKLTVVMVEPHKVPYVAEIEDELSALQKAVGGYIEVVGNGDGTLIICNEEEKLEGLEGNRRIHDGASIIAGTFFVVGEDGENFRSLTDSETVKYMERFAEPEDISQDEVESDIIIIVVMPIVAVVSIFNGNIEIDTDRLQTMLVQNLSAEEKAKLQFVEDTMNSIDEKMKAAGFDGRVKEAQVLYVLALSDSSHDPDFADKLVSCFQENQTDEQLIAAVNSAFGTQLTAEDFGKVMGNIRSLYIDISD